MSDDVQSVKDPLSLREMLGEKGVGVPAQGTVVSVRDIPDLSRFGLSEDYLTVLVKIDDGFYVDTIIAEDGNKPNVDEVWEFVDDGEGSGFPIGKKVVAEADDAEPKTE